MKRTRRWTVEITEAAPRIAEAIMPMVRQYPECPPGLQFHYETVLDRMARDLENFIRPRASVAALKKAEAMGFPDIRQFHWTQQRGRMCDRDREIFHWEHVVPCANIVRDVLSKDTVEGITQVLLSAEVAWILKEEDDRLTHRNRGDPRADYERAGIVLV